MLLELGQGKEPSSLDRAVIQSATNIEEIITEDSESIPKLVSTDAEFGVFLSDTLYTFLHSLTHAAYRTSLCRLIRTQGVYSGFSQP